MPLFPQLKIAQKLPVILVGSALVVGLGIGIAAYMIGLQTVDKQREQSFSASVQSATDQVDDYFRNVSIDTADPRYRARATGGCARRRGSACRLPSARRV